MSPKENKRSLAENKNGTNDNRHKKSASLVVDPRLLFVDNTKKMKCAKKKETHCTMEFVVDTDLIHIIIFP